MFELLFQHIPNILKLITYLSMFTHYFQLDGQWQYSDIVISEVITFSLLYLVWGLFTTICLNDLYIFSLFETRKYNYPWYNQTFSLTKHVPLIVKNIYQGFMNVIFLHAEASLLQIRRYCSFIHSPLVETNVGIHGFGCFQM